jgi:hypothetical protein
MAFLNRRSPSIQGNAPSSSQSRRSVSSSSLGAQQRISDHFERRDCCRVAYAADRRDGRRPLVLVDCVRAHRPRREPADRLGHDPPRGPATVCQGMALGWSEQSSNDVPSLQLARSALIRARLWQGCTRTQSQLVGSRHLIRILTFCLSGWVRRGRPIGLKNAIADAGSRYQAFALSPKHYFGAARRNVRPRVGCQRK